MQACCLSMMQANKNRRNYVVGILIDHDVPAKIMDGKFKQGIDYHIAGKFGGGKVWRIWRNWRNCKSFAK